MITKAIRSINSVTLAGAGAAATGSAVPVYGADQIDFHFVAGNSVTPGTEAGIDVSDNGTNWFSGAGQQVTVRNGTANGNRLDTGGVTVSFAPNSGLRFGWRYARPTLGANVTGGQDITTLVCDATVQYDDSVCRAQEQPRP